MTEVQAIERSRSRYDETPRPDSGCAGTFSRVSPRSFSFTSSVAPACDPRGGPPFDHTDGPACKEIGTLQSRRKTDPLRGTARGRHWLTSLTPTPVPAASASSDQRGSGQDRTAPVARASFRRSRRRPLATRPGEAPFSRVSSRRRDGCSYGGIQNL